MRTKSHLRQVLALGVAAFALAPAGGVGAAAAAEPVATTPSPFAKGPDPTVASLQATKGPYAVSKTAIPNSATPGFGAATVWAPSGTTGETFGGVAVAPGFLADGSTMAWLGPRLATQGFVVITFSTNSIFDPPAARGRQLLAALDYLTGASPSKALVDPARLAVAGHSAGGGGTLDAAKRRPNIKAAVGITPASGDWSWPEIKSPTLIIGGTRDVIAPAPLFAIPIFGSLPAALPKAYLELKIDHLAPLFPNGPIATTTIAWLKRYVDDDRRYAPLLCPLPAAVPASQIKTYRSSCAS